MTQKRTESCPQHTWKWKRLDTEGGPFLWILNWKKNSYFLKVGCKISSAEGEEEYFWLYLLPLSSSLCGFYSKWIHINHGTCFLLIQTNFLHFLGLIVIKLFCVPIEKKWFFFILRFINKTRKNMHRTAHIYKYTHTRACV